MVHNRQKLFRYAVDTFLELLEQVTKKKKEIKCNDVDVSSFHKFVDKFGDNIGEEFIRKYIEYQVQSWFNDGSDIDYSRQIRFTWLFGAKAIQRWDKNDIRTNVFITRIGLKKNHKINLIKHDSQLSELLNTVRIAEEKMKEQCLNTKRGLPWCVANTSLYFHKSSICAMCEYKSECKDVLKNEYPKVYKLRGYGD